MVDLLLENVRCFYNKHAVPIRPLTFLVGENSSGKSTLLAILAAMSQQGRFPWRPNFNLPPYDLGNFTTIATYRGGQAGRASHFSIGYRAEAERPGTPRQALQADYNDRDGQPTLRELRIDLGGTSLAISPSDKGFELRWARAGTKDLIRRPLPLRFVLDNLPLDVFLELLWNVPRHDRRAADLLRHLNRLDAGRRLLREVLMPARSLSPVRTRPQRTYDMINDEFRPEGDHVPIILSRLWSERDSKRRSAVIEALGEFGRESGLFKKIDVRRLGLKQSTDPFQIEVTVAGRPANISDVGYGVSQALPVLVESILAAPQQRMLLQQPEVHLHPRAQAALGTFFVRLVVAGQKQFVVETHSDYLIDRVRQEVARERIRADAVQIICLDRQGTEVSVHPLTLDQQGNIIRSAPDISAVLPGRGGRPARAEPRLNVPHHRREHGISCLRVARCGAAPAPAGAAGRTCRGRTRRQADPGVQGERGRAPDDPGVGTRREGQAAARTRG